MMLKKKALSLAIASAFAMTAFSSTVYAQQTVELIDANSDFLEDLIDDSLEIDETDLRVISAAFNIGSVNASINIQAGDITFAAGGTSTATATSNAESAVEGATASVTAISSAVSGNSFRTVAVGAVNDTEVSVSSISLYNRTSTVSLADTDSTTDQDALDSLNLTGRGGFEAWDKDPEEIGIFQSAVNTADINGSVNIMAGTAPINAQSFWGKDAGGYASLAIADLSISTTAIGASNSGKVTILSGRDVITTTNLTTTVSDFNN